MEREKPHLQLKTNDLDLDLQAAYNQLLHDKNAYMASEEDKRAMLAENSIFEGKLQEMELRAESLRIAFGLLNEENSILRSKLMEADRDIYNLKFERDELLCDNMFLEIKAIELSIELKTAKDILGHLEKLISSAEMEKVSFMSEILLLKEKLKHALFDKEKLERQIHLLRQEKMINSGKLMEDTTSDLLLLRCTFELQEEVLQEVQPMLDISKEDIIEMVKHKGDLEQIIKILFYLSSGNEISQSKMENGFCKISDLEAVGKKLEDFLIKYKNWKGSYYDAGVKANNEKMEEMAEKDQTMCKFETVCTEEKKNICKLNDCYTDLLGKMHTEMAKKDEQFKIGETEREKRQESFKRFVEGLQGLRLIGLETFFNELQQVNSVSFGSMKHTEQQVAECLLELQDVKAFVELEWHLKRKLEKEKHELELKLRYQQGIIRDLEDEASRKVVELAQKEKQLKVLEMMVAESKRNLKEKEREVLDKDEEKREAIRQLCLLNEYYRENYNNLTKHVSSMHQSRKPS